MPFELDEVLVQMVESEGSDLILKVGAPPLLRIYGDLNTLPYPPFTPEQVREVCYSLMTDRQRAMFERDWELDFGYEVRGVARYRGNCFVQRGNMGAVFRLIPLVIRTVEELGLPEVCRYFADRPRGLVLVTGPAGCGKSTTQAAMLDYINEHYACHIVTVEDPVEFVHEDKRAMVNQRELGNDTLSFANALKYVLRQDPDVILVGEMRDLETIQLAIRAAETGHLVLGTLHTTDAVQTVDRCIDIFPTHQQQQIRMQLSVNLLGVVSQILVKRRDMAGRVAAFETLVAIPAVRSAIRDRKTHHIASMIQTGSRQGMMTLDHSLAELARRGIVAVEEARAKAKDPEEFERIVGEESVQARAPIAPA